MEMEGNCFSYEAVEESSKFIKERISIVPRVGIVCGSGLGSLADSIEEPVYIDYKDIPNFPVSTVVGHAGCLIIGHLEGIPIVAMKGRSHFYEGNSLPICCFPIRVLKLLGITHLIVTNAAGGIEPSLDIGAIMIIRDHINLLGFGGTSPLIGLNDGRFGSRFVSMANAYDSDLIRQAHKIAKENGFQEKVKEGVYSCVAGPNYETVAEGRFLKLIGVDAVGMSTVHEVITARQCGLIVFGFSVITNKVDLDYDQCNEPDHTSIVDVGISCEKVGKEIVRKLVKYIDYKKTTTTGDKLIK